MKLTDEQLTRLVVEKVIGWQVIPHQGRVDQELWILPANGAPMINPMRFDEFKPLEEWKWAGLIAERMGSIGWWLKLTSPFEADSMWQAGFTPLSTTGWNGRPDHRCASKSGQRAIVISALLAVEAITADQVDEETGYL